MDVTRQIANIIESLCCAAAASNSSKLTGESWESILYFCLIICHSVIAPPLPVSPNLVSLQSPTSNQSTNPNGVTNSSGSNVDPTAVLESTVECLANLLFNTWLKASEVYFPKPQLWALLADCTKVWRHHNAFLYQWSRVMVALTGSVLDIMYNFSDSSRNFLIFDRYN